MTKTVVTNTVANGVKKNGQFWYKVNGKFCNHATYYNAVVEIEAAMSAAHETNETKKKWDGNINPALLLVIGVILLVFIIVMFGMIIGNADIANCGKFTPWGSHGVIWFVEDTCRAIRVTKE